MGPVSDPANLRRAARIRGRAVGLAAMAADTMHAQYCKRQGPRMLRRLNAIVRYGDTEPTELGATLYTILYGLWFIGPATFAFSPAFDLLSGLIGENLFGALTATVGLIPLFGLAVGSRGLRRAGAFSGLIFWSFIATLVGISSHGHAGGLPHFTLAAVTNAWLYLRLTIRQVQP